MEDNRVDDLENSRLRFEEPDDPTADDSPHGHTLQRGKLGRLLFDVREVSARKNFLEELPVRVEDYDRVRGEIN
jgi:hypothetical protein